MTSHGARQVHRFYEEIWNGPDLVAVPNVLAAGVTFRGSLGDEMVGRDRFAEYVRQVHAGLHGYRCRIDHLVDGGERVAARMTFGGRHDGTFLGFAASGREVSWVGVAFFAFAGGLATDVWVLGDLHGLRAQLARGPVGPWG